MTELMPGALADDPFSRAIEKDLTPTTPGEVLGATAESFWEALPNVKFTTLVRRHNESGMDPAIAEHWRNYRDPAGRNENSNALNDAAIDAGPAPVRDEISPEEANTQVKEAGVAGMTPYTKPVDRRTLAGHIQDAQRQSERQSIIDRNASLLSGVIPRFATGALVSLLDPLNVAAMVIPTAPQAFVAARLAAAGGVAGRTAVRAGIGAAEGAVGMAALEPLNYALDSAAHREWHAGDALLNLAFGAALGAAGRVVLGGVFGAGERMPYSQEAREAAFRTAVAQVAEDRPVNVAGLLDHYEAARTLGAMERFARAVDRLDAEQATTRAEAAALRGRADTAVVPDRAFLQSAAERRLGELEVLQRELTQDVAARQDDLFRLEARRMMGADPLESGRTAAEVRGLEAELARVNAERLEIEQARERMTEATARETTRAEALRAEAKDVEDWFQTRRDGLDATLQHQFERVVRQYAGGIGTELERGEAARIAREIRTAQPAERADVMVHAIESLAARRTRPDTSPELFGPPPPNPHQALETQATGVQRQMADEAKAPRANSAIVEAATENRKLIDNAPKFEEDPAKMAAEAEKLHADAKAAYEKKVALGQIGEAEVKALDDAVAQAAKEIDDAAKAEGAYATCAAPAMRN